MGLTLSPRQVGWTLLGLTAIAVALTAYMVATAGHTMDPEHYAPAAILVLVTAAWPFVNGWRPFATTAARIKTCGECGAQWKPATEGGVRFCPACGTS
jgi:hypothetical protein